MYSNYETLIAVILIVLLLFFTLNLDRHYTSTLHSAGKHPFIRFLAGAMIVFTATINPLLAMLSLLIVFFWIGDVHIVSLN